MFFLTPSLDLTLFLIINQQLRFGLFDILMPILSSMTVLFAVMAVALVFAIVKGGKRQIIFFLILLAGMGISDFTTGLIKKEVNRVRPLNAIAETHFREDGKWQQRPTDFVRKKEVGRSYPSAHSSNSMCLAVLAILCWPALKKWPLVLPLLVGYSRLYLGKHYPTDVLAGWLYGFVVACAVWLVWKYGISRLIPKKS